MFKECYFQGELAKQQSMQKQTLHLRYIQTRSDSGPFNLLATILLRVTQETSHSDSLKLIYIHSVL